MNATGLLNIIVVVHPYRLSAPCSQPEDQILDLRARRPLNGAPERVSCTTSLTSTSQPTTADAPVGRAHIAPVTSSNGTPFPVDQQATRH
jgi:hypothetical protein